MSYDYSAFADGQLAEVLAGNRERAAWSNQAHDLQARLNEANLTTHAKSFQTKAWLEVAKIMRDKIAELDPNSALADKDYLNNLYHSKVDELAASEGMVYHRDGSVTPRR